MNFGKRVLLGGTLICALLAGAAAQSSDNQQSDRPPQAQQQQRRLALLAQKLNLTADQKRQWMQIQKQTARQIRAVRKDDSLSEEQMQAQLKEIHKQQRDQIMALLTPEQQAELKTFWEEQKQRQQSNSSSSSDSPAQTKEDDAADDLFAGMVSDDPAPPPQPSQNKKAK
ncbi:MAG TPA: hypothetical protein VJA94_02500 [Candidatus Angelobacter sp.]